MGIHKLTDTEYNVITEGILQMQREIEDLQNYLKERQPEAFDLCAVGSMFTEEEALFINTLLLNKLLSKEDNGTYKAVKNIEIIKQIFDKINK